LSVLRAVTTFLIVSLTFVLFRAGGLQDALWIYGALVTGARGVITVAQTKPLIAIVMVVAYDLLVTWARDSKPLPPWLRWSCYYAAVACIIAATIDHVLQASPHVQQFIYFKF
jgi:alginate O-acetyltransferase complex protein AlgI